MASGPSRYIVACIVAALEVKWEVIESQVGSDLNSDFGPIYLDTSTCTHVALAFFQINVTLHCKYSGKSPHFAQNERDPRVSNEL